ncbi:glycosyltransferase family 2 protein [Lederbergia citri]|uniref:Glycosyltransferase n=1 Tax=Lederbergia citri TaxID=2833580 RepID=A0A942TKC7_9BACI|nr:glycosyltransferase [Lederbergia citri]MBS4197579.1 glycosyltransferase [Lederbergia citri]
MKPLISIIVPVYNVQSYLTRCIDSILDQTFTNFELILVNDGSLDNSGEVCDEFAKKDSRIVVIHKENGGVSSARNVGIDVANGQYIGFIDSDDYIHPKMYEILYQYAIRHSSDIVMCDYLKVSEGENPIMRCDKALKLLHYTNIEALNQLYITEPRNSLGWIVVWNKLFKRKLFHELRFTEGRIYEDELIAHKVFYSCLKITYVADQLYYYYQRSDSYIGSSFSTKKFDRVYALKERVDFFRSIGQQHLFNLALKHFMEVFFWYYTKAKLDLNNVNKELKGMKRALDKSLIFLLKNPLIGLKQKIFLVLFVLNPKVLKVNKG